jgi:hypothetical protein
MLPPEHALVTFYTAKELQSNSAFAALFLILESHVVCSCNSPGTHTSLVCSGRLSRGCEP